MTPLRKKIFYYLSYFRRPPWDTGITPPELIRFIDSHPIGRALDLGCGTGTNAIALAKAGWQVTGIDFVGKAVRKARKKAQQAKTKIDLYVSDVTKLEFLTVQFDLILDIGCYHSLTPQGKLAYAQNLRRLLSPDGTYLLYGFLADPSNPSIGITADDLKSLESVVKKVNKEIGSDRGERPSAWMTFQRY